MDDVEFRYSLGAQLKLSDKERAMLEFLTGVTIKQWMAAIEDIEPITSVYIDYEPQLDPRYYRQSRPAQFNLYCMAEDGSSVLRQRWFGDYIERVAAAFRVDDLMAMHVYLGSETLSEIIKDKIGWTRPR